LPGPPASGRHMGFQHMRRRRPQALAAVPSVMPVDGVVGQALRPHTHRRSLRRAGLPAGCRWASVPCCSAVWGGRGAVVSCVPCAPSRTPGSAKLPRPSDAPDRSTSQGAGACRPSAEGFLSSWGYRRRRWKGFRAACPGSGKRTRGEPSPPAVRYVSGRAAVGGRGRIRVPVPCPGQTALGSFRRVSGLPVPS
jgi:hypothetical protein